MQEKTVWPKKPRAKSTFVALLRQFVVQEYSAERLYSHIPSMADVDNVCAMENLLLQADAKQPDKGAWTAFSAVQLSLPSNTVFPFTTSIHRFLKTHDSVWYDAFKVVCEADK